MDRRKDRRLMLFTPGPVEISCSARQAFLSGALHHRSEEFESILASLIDSAKIAFGTDGIVVVIAGSGTAAMEAAVACLFGPEQAVLIPAVGKFSRRWIEICSVYGVHTRVIELEPGESPEPDQVIKMLNRFGDVDGVLLTHCETSTGALTDLENVCAEIRGWGRKHGRHPLIVADCISTLCVDHIIMDTWGIDCAISASQKGLLCPPGLAIVAVGQHAQNRLRSSRCRTYYLDLRKYIEAGLKHPFTPPVHIVNAVRASLASILNLGIENVLQSYRLTTLAIRDLLEQAGLRRVARRQASAVVALWTGAVDSRQVTDYLFSRHGILIADGQGELSGRIVRISALGKSPDDLIRLGEALDNTLRYFGIGVDRQALMRYMEVVEGSGIWL